MSRRETGAERTLADIVASLEATVLRVASGSAALGQPVGAVTIFERTDPQAVRLGAVILAVGIAADQGDAITLLDHAARHGAAAVVLRAERLPARLLETARALDLAVLTVPTEMEWGQLYSLLRTAMVGSGSVADAGTGGVPVGDLFALADAIAAAIGGPVTIEDPQWRVLAYSNLDQPIDGPRRQTILGRTPPREWQRRLEQAGVVQALRTGDGPVSFRHEGVRPRLVTPIRAGQQLLGSIWVAQGAEAFSPADEEELQRAGVAAAVHLVAHRRFEDVERRNKGMQLRELLEGRAAPGTRLRERGTFTALCFELDGAEERWRGDPGRLLSIVALFLEGLDADAMCALVDDRIWALVPRRGGDLGDELLEAAEKVIDRAERVLGAELIAGVGAPVESLEDVPRSRLGAERAVRVRARRRTGTRLAHIDDVREHAALLELLDLARGQPALREGAVADLAAHDAAAGSDLVGTLRAYLDCHADVVRAAALLSVHPNTLRYRLRRLQEIAGIDLADADARLVYEVQLRLG